MILVGVFLGGAAGAALRGLVYFLVSRLRWDDLPVATSAVNVAGAFLLGSLTGLALSHDLSAAWMAFWGGGFCGALTTFSTWQNNLLSLAEAKRWRDFSVHVVVDLIAGIGAVAMGLEIGRIYG